MEEKRCPICNSTNTELLLDLGNQPPANELARSEIEAKNVKKFNLSLRICNECLYVWLNETIPPEVLFVNNPYLTGISSTTRRDMLNFYESCQTNCNIHAGQKVLDIASNDGTLLAYFKENGCNTLGVDPSKDAFKIAAEKGIATINNFFNEDTSRMIITKYGKFDLITATNLITHVENPAKLLAINKSLLQDGGNIALEFYYFEAIISNNAFDQIYHEHISYFNLTTFMKLIQKIGLEIFHVELVPSQGGSLRVFLSLPGKHSVDKTVSDILSREGSHEEIRTRYKKFAISSLQRADAIKTILKSKLKEGKVIAGYGASAKATVLTNYLNLSSNVIRAIVDLSSTKQGKFIPGTAIPVVPPEDLIEVDPDVVVIFSWNIANEVLRQVSQLLRKNFTALIFMPEISEKIIAGGVP